MKNILITAMAIVLAVWNIFYILVLTDSLIEEYFWDRFFYWGYPQWGNLYASPRIFLWFNVFYIGILMIEMLIAWILRKHYNQVLTILGGVAFLSLLNSFVPRLNRYVQLQHLPVIDFQVKGSVPEGIWIADPRFMQNYADQNILSKIKGLWGRGFWPGGYALWGNYRVWLYASAKTDDQGKRGLVIHGGTGQGSPWGMNLGQDIDEFANNLQNQKHPMRMMVSYER